MYTNYTDSTLSWFDSRVNNALIESMNSLIQAIKEEQRATATSTTISL
ncbi:transposase [Alicyclobacillus suci]